MVMLNTLLFTCLHSVKLHRLLSEAIKQIVGVLRHSEVVQPLLRRHEESLVAILVIVGNMYSENSFHQSDTDLPAYSDTFSMSQMIGLLVNSLWLQ